MTIFLAILGRIWPYLIALALSGFAFWKAEHWCNASCIDFREKYTEAEQRVKDAQTKLAVLDRARIKQQEEWASETAAEELRARSDAASRESAFTPIRKRVLVDPVVAAAVLPPVLAGVSADAYAAAEPTKPTQVSPDPAKTNSAAAWIVDVYGWMAECRDRVSEWERFYQSLRSAN